MLIFVERKSRMHLIERKKNCPLTKSEMELFSAFLVARSGPLIPNVKKRGHHHHRCRDSKQRPKAGEKKKVSERRVPEMKKLAALFWNHFPHSPQSIPLILLKGDPCGTQILNFFTTFFSERQRLQRSLVLKNAQRIPPSIVSRFFIKKEFTEI